MESFLLNRKTKKSYMETIMSLAVSSKASYKSVLNRLEEFCTESYQGRTAGDIVQELKSIPLEDSLDIKERILKITPTERKKLGINKSTLWYQKKNLAAGKRIKLYSKVLSKLV